MIYAIVETGGKQYFVSPGMKLKAEKLPGSEKLINFDKVLLVINDQEISFGKPYLKNVEVLGERVAEGRSKKVIVFKYHNKTRYRKKKGHRQPFTEVLIKEINI